MENEKCVKCKRFKKNNNYICSICCITSLPQNVNGVFKKENMLFIFIHNYLFSNFGIECVFNKVVEDSKLRPDIIINLSLDKSIIIEIDEYQHRYYNIEKEKEREYKLLNSIQNSMLIRINVDSYTEKKIKYPCIWKKTHQKTGEWYHDAVQVETNTFELECRLSVIYKTINYFIMNHEVGSVYRLFFSEPSSF